MHSTVTVPNHAYSNYAQLCVVQQCTGASLETFNLDHANNFTYYILQMK